MTPVGKLPSPAALDRQLQVAFDLVCRARPLKPPPCNFEQRRISAAELAARADKRAGLL